MKLSIALAALLITMHCMTLPATHEGLSDTFTLKFDYAARQRKALVQSSFVCIWNGETLVDQTPEDYDVHTLTFEVKGKVGENILNFVGTGTHYYYGAGITHVQLIRNGNHEDPIVNGNFNQGLGWGNYRYYKSDKINGWTTNDIIEVGKGRYYNKNWDSSDKVCELNAKRNVDMTQSIYFNEDLETVDYYKKASSGAALSNKFTLKFEYAAKQKKPLTYSSFVCIWNGETLADVTPEDYSVNTLTFEVEGIVGENILNFAGTGTHYYYGAGITHVSLTRAGNHEDVITNGDFDQNIRNSRYRYYKEGTIPGWEAALIEIGKGHFYNQNWNVDDKVCELNAKRNVDMLQYIYLDSKYNVDEE